MTSKQLTPADILAITTHQCEGVVALKKAQWLAAHQDLALFEESAVVNTDENMPSSLGECCATIDVGKNTTGDAAIFRGTVNGKGTRFFVSETACVEVRQTPGHLYAVIIGTDANEVHRLWEKFDALKAAPSKIYVIVNEHGVIRPKPLTSVSKQIEWDNYAPETRDELQFLIDELMVDEPTGRLTLISGPPGTGKTHVLKGLSQHVDSPILLFPASQVSALESPDGVPMLEMLAQSHPGKPLIVVVEDGDSCVAPRGADNMSKIAAVLNLSDGILGTSLDIRFVITTNAEVGELEEALMRPGRLSQHIIIGNLDVEIAKAVWSRLTDKGPNAHGSPTKAMSLSEVYASTKPTRSKPQKKRSMGFGIAS